MIIVGLIKKDVLAITSLDADGKILECPVFGNAVVLAEELPELTSDLVPALPCLDRDEFARHRGEVGGKETSGGAVAITTTIADVDVGVAERVEVVLDSRTTHGRKGASK